MLRKWFGKKKDGEAEATSLPEAPGVETPPSAPEGQPPAPQAPDPAPEERRPPAERERSPPPAECERSHPRASRWSLFSRALEKTRRGLKSVFSFRRKLDDALLCEIETELYAADFGPDLVADLIDGPGGIRVAWKERRIENADDVREFLKARLREMLTRREGSLRTAAEPPTVILVAGVNGTGKTTSIAKLAKRFRDDGKKVVLAAADTFRAAAVEQLTIWSQRLGVEIVTGSPGSDPGSVAYRSAEAALAGKADVLIVDTAGRLHTQRNLMKELGKIRSVLAKRIPGSPHESLLVLDATTGQNALTQARTFQEEIQITGIILAKLDGTAKGGIVVTINNALEIPVKLVGVGEKVEDLEPFDVDGFVEALFA